jgi:hypothetical protein
MVRGIMVVVGVTIRTLGIKGTAGNQRHNPFLGHQGKDGPSSIEPIKTVLADHRTSRNSVLVCFKSIW